MNIVFKQVRLKNFMSFEDATFRLDTGGYTLITGVNNNPADMALNNGAGKCFGAGTKVLMWDGTIKNVEDIKVNDIVMGQDSTPRIVVETHTGRSNMYEVSAARGNYRYTCNGDHILCLKKTLNKDNDLPEYVEISVQDWLRQSDPFKRSYCQFINPVKEFYHNPTAKFLLDPYFLGLWLGDGTRSCASICTIDPEIVAFLEQYVQDWPGVHLQITRKTKTDACNYHLSIDKESGGRRNPILESLKHYNLINNKHIPLEYLTATEDDRLKLLAGLIDTDGCLVKSKKFSKKSLKYNWHYAYEFTQLNNQLASDVVQLARNLGFKVSKDIRSVLLDKQTGRSKSYARIRISGDIQKIPVRIERKICPQSWEDSRHICYSLHPTIKPIGEGTFYGFQITGDGKFLLADNTVVHNSTLWDSISYSLTGETIRGSSDIVNKVTGGDAEVTLDFSIDGTDYQIIRGKTADKAKSTLRLFVDGKDESGKGIRDAQAILKSRIPDMTSLLLGSVIIFGQGLPQGFANNTPAGRKEILEKLSKSDFMIEDLKQRISARRTQLSDIIRSIEDSKLSDTSKKKLLESQIELATQKINMLTDPVEARLKAAELEAEITTIQNNIETERGKLTKLEEENSTNMVAQQTLNSEKITRCFEIDNKYSNELSEIATAESSKTIEIQSLANQIRQLDSVVDICPTCGQKLQGVDKVDTTDLKATLGKLKEELDGIRENKTKITSLRDAEKHAIEVEIANQSVVLLNKGKQLQTDIQAAKLAISGYDLSIKKNKTEISSLELVVNNYESVKQSQEDIIKLNQKTVEEISKSLEELETELDNAKAHLDVVNKMNTIASRDFRGYLLNSIIAFIDKKAKEYSQKIFETDKLAFCLDGNNISITYCDKEFESLSGGEKQKVSLIIQFAIRDMLCSYLNFSSNILVLDEIVDFLDKMGADRIINLISTELTDITTIFFITHHTDLLFPCDKEIIITKGKDGISRI